MTSTTHQQLSYTATSTTPPKNICITFSQHPSNTLITPPPHHNTIPTRLGLMVFGFQGLGFMAHFMGLGCQG